MSKPLYQRSHESGKSALIHAPQTRLSAELTQQLQVDLAPNRPGRNYPLAPTSLLQRIAAAQARGDAPNISPTLPVGSLQSYGQF